MAENSLAERVGQALCEAGHTVAVAESSSGGLVSSLLTDVAGASAYFDRGVVTYSNASKVELLGVDPATLERHGAVAGQTACEMAHGVRDLAGTTWGVSTTGVAGPGGGTSEKPVGTVYVAVARADGSGASAPLVDAERYEFDGPRTACKRQFARQALTDLLAAVESR